SVGQTELVLREVGADGVTFGPELLRVRPSGIDDFGMTRFPFDAIPDSGGRTYAFELDCPGCTDKFAPGMWANTAPRGPGNLLVSGRLLSLQAAAFAPLYAGMAEVAPSTTQLAPDRTGPGHWRIQTDGEQGSLVVVAEANFPGWQARVDGKPAPVLTADGGFLGVAVGPGHHVVSLDYHRTSAATVGRVVTVATLLICLLMMCPPLRRRVARLTRRSRLRGRRSAGPGHALDVGAPPSRRRRKQALDPGNGVPDLTAPEGQPPGRERDQAVLTAVDHVEAGPADEVEERGRGEP
ncbi:MAG: hypothetical protein V7605_725, partial [Acidimicrobiaceae bacterium]